MKIIKYRYFSFVKTECSYYDLSIIYFPTKLPDNQYRLGFGYLFYEILQAPFKILLIINRN